MIRIYRKWLTCLSFVFFLSFVLNAKPVHIKITILNAKGTPQTGLKLQVPGFSDPIVSDEYGVLAFEYEYEKDKTNWATLNHSDPAEGVAKTFPLIPENFAATFYIDSRQDILTYKRENTTFPLQGELRSFSGEKIVGASVSVRGGSTVVKSDTAGVFHLSAGYNTVLMVRAENYETEILPAHRFLEYRDKPYSIYLKPFDSAKLYTNAPIMPAYPGGLAAFQKYVNAHRKNVKEKGVVVVQFIVERDGTITEAQVMRPLSNEADAEALRLIQGMEKWIPAKQGETPVRCRYSLPVHFPDTNSAKQ